MATSGTLLPPTCLLHFLQQVDFQRAQQLVAAAEGGKCVGGSCQSESVRPRTGVRGNRCSSAKLPGVCAAGAARRHNVAAARSVALASAAPAVWRGCWASELSSYRAVAKRLAYLIAS